MTQTDRVNTAPLYPPLFYATLSVFAGPDIQTSVLLMRLFNIVVVVGVLTGLFWTLPRRLRPMLLVASVVPSVPLGVFVIASTNPSAWAYLAASTVFPSVYGTTQTHGRRRLALAGFAVLGTVIGAGARADAAAFAVFATILALVAAAARWRASTIPWVTVVAVAGISVAFFFSARQGGSAVDGLPGFTEPLTLGQHVSNFLNVPTLWTGAVGGWGLGWLDTTLPSVVVVLGTLCVGAALAIGTWRPTRTGVVALLLAGAALWIVPFILLAQSRALVGSQVQPRYILPLLVILLAVASTGRLVGPAWRGFRLAVVVCALALSNAVAMNFNIRRYTTGTDGQGSYDPGRDAEWWWTGVPSPLITWVVGSVAFALALALVWWAMQRTDRSSDDGVEGSDGVTGSRADGDDRGASAAEKVAGDRDPAAAGTRSAKTDALP